MRRRPGTINTVQTASRFTRGRAHRLLNRYQGGSWVCDDESGAVTSYFDLQQLVASFPCFSLACQVVQCLQRRLSLENSVTVKETCPFKSKTNVIHDQPTLGLRSPPSRPHRSVSDNELQTLPSGIFDNLQSLDFL